MKKGIFIAVSCAAVSVSVMTGMAFGHGAGKHRRTMQEDAQMKKLHAMMPAFSTAVGNMETALKSNDKAIFESEAKRILAAIPDLKKSKPHRNVKQRREFVELAGQLEAAVKETADSVRSGDIANAKKYFSGLEKTCAACHAKFRD